MIRTSSQLQYLRENISRIASDSQPLWHPLGFVSCVIRKVDQEFTTRIHYWPKLERRTKNPDWPIHNHTYDLYSCILEGRVRDIRYDLVEGNEYTIYSVSYSGQNSTINQTDRRTSVKQAVNAVHEVGEEYNIAAGTFHQSQVLREETAITLVVLTNFADGQPLVLGTAEEKQYPYDRVAFDNFSFWRRVKDAISAT